MKKITIFLAAAMCAFGLTACGEAEKLTEYEQYKVEYAENLSTQVLVPFLNDVCQGEEFMNTFDGYTMDEIAFVGEYYLEYYGLTDYEVDGYGLYNSFTSFSSSYDSIGKIVEYGEASAEIDDEQIIVNMPVVCEKGTANVEVIVTNDMFCSLKSATINQEYTMGEKMKKAGLNTAIGIGTVFIVLILISLIISIFGVIPKIQKSIADSKAEKEAEKNATAKSIDNAVNQIIANETVDESDDLELVAVIAAAIAAYEGSATTEGYVVRSIRRRR